MYKQQLHEINIQNTYIIVDIYIDFDFQNQSTLLGREGLWVDMGREESNCSRWCLISF